MIHSYKKTLDIKNLQVNPPVKKDNIRQWTCDVSYNSSPFLIQTPRIRIIKETGTLIFKVNSKKNFLDYLAGIEDSVVKIIHDNSSKFFSGKKFSMEKITDSLSQSWDIDDDGFVYLQPSNVGEDLKDIKCVDMFNNEISYENIQENVSAVLHIESIIFTKKLFKIMYKIDRLKMSKFVDSDKTNPFEESNLENAILKLDILNEDLQNEDLQNEDLQNETHDDADFFD